MTRFPQSSAFLFASCLLGQLMTGCTTLDSVPVPFSNEKPVPTATLKNPAIRSMGLWQPGEGDGVDDSTTGRGFVGQIYFFTARSATPVAVDGDVRVYVFDDVGTPEEQKKPIHQFDFKDGAWQGYQSESAIGPCYNIYVPYTRKGNMEAKCHLRLRLTRPDGTQLHSEIAEVQLEGTARESSVMKRLRTTPEYDLNPKTQQEWEIQASTIGIQKAGRFERTPDAKEQAAAAAYFAGNESQASRPAKTPTTLNQPAPNGYPSSNLHQLEQIRALEQKLIELHSRRQPPAQQQQPMQQQPVQRHVDVPQRSFTPQATEPQLTPPRQFEPPGNAQQLTPQAQFRPLSSTRHIPDVVPYAEPESAKFQTLSYEQPATRRRAEESTQAKVNELRAILEGH